MSPKNLKNIYVGTSGFSYEDWLGNFYPQFCPKADFLRFYTSVFKTVEIDSTYYRMPTKDMICRWHKQTPDDFVFTAKFPRMVTHEGGIEERLEYRDKFIEIMENLGDKLGPLLMQFPYSFKPDQNYNTITQLISGLPKDRKYVVEVRNRKWLTESFAELLKSKNICLARVDHPWMPKDSYSTMDYSYIRLLGDRKKIASDFSFIRNERVDDLQWWSHLIEELSGDKGEVYVYVNNHYTGHSPSAARKLAELINY